MCFRFMWRLFMQQQQTQARTWVGKQARNAPGARRSGPAAIACATDPCPTGADAMNAKTLWIAAALTALISAQAAAADEKFYPGAACQTSNKDQVVFRNEQGRMYNSSAATQQTWICPIVRDQAGAAGILDAAVVVEDHNPGVGSTSDVRCTLISRTAEGLQIAAQPQETEGAPGVTTLNYVAVASVADGYYYFNCTIPKQAGLRSGIISYRVRE
jgi:hypothetical protein